MLFRSGVTKKTISEHLGNIFESKELQREATVRNFRTVQNVIEEGKMRLTVVADTEQLFHLIQTVLSPEAELFKLSKKIKQYN